MENDVKKIDALIKESLNAEEAQFYDDLGEKDLFGKMGTIYQSRMGWLVVAMHILTVLFFALFVYCAFRFMNTDEVGLMIKWAVAGFLCWSFMAMMKLYVWMQMDKSDVLRELKRIELQLAIMKEDRTTQKKGAS